jgi:hypothetical protein
VGGVLVEGIEGSRQSLGQLEWCLDGFARVAGALHPCHLVSGFRG